MSLTPSKRSHNGRDIKEPNGKRYQQSPSFGTRKQFSPRRSSSVAAIIFRVLCPAAKVANVTGKANSVINQIRQETGAKIRVDEPIPGCDERVIFIMGSDKESTFVAEVGTERSDKETIAVGEPSIEPSTIDDEDGGSNYKEETKEKGNEEETKEKGDDEETKEKVDEEETKEKVDEEETKEKGEEEETKEKGDDEETNDKGDDVETKEKGDDENVENIVIENGVEDKTDENGDEVLIHENVENGEKGDEAENDDHDDKRETEGNGENEDNGDNAVKNEDKESSSPVTKDSQSGKGTSAVQSALLLVFEKMLEKGETEEDHEGEGSEEKDESSSAILRLLVLSSQVGCLLGKGGSIIKQTASGSGTQIRVLPRDKHPSCASQSDEVVQVHPEPYL